jgi:hypothetical protein
MRPNVERRSMEEASLPQSGSIGWSDDLLEGEAKI